MPHYSTNFICALVPLIALSLFTVPDTCAFVSITPNYLPFSTTSFYEREPVSLRLPWFFSALSPANGRVGGVNGIRSPAAFLGFALMRFDLRSLYLCRYLLFF